MEKTVVVTTMLCLIMKHVKTQYAYSQNQFRAYDAYNDMDPMDMYYDYDSSECSCVCQTCEDVKPCCRNVCVNCFHQTSSSIVIVPYPYPLIISTKQKSTNQPQDGSTTETSKPSPTPSTPISVPPADVRRTDASPTLPTPGSTPPPDVLRTNDAFNDIIAEAPRVNERNKFVLTSLRRTKPNWMPKYGIVPISDNLAEKLMLQLRSMRVLHPRKETFTHTDTLSSLEKN